MKFLDTNLPVENFVSGLRNTKDNLPDMVNKWSELDEELKREYLEQLTWLLEKSAEFIEKESKKSFWCDGCGEPRYKCACDVVCTHCGKKAIDCSSESDSGWCPLDPNLENLLAMQKELRSGNKKV